MKKQAVARLGYLAARQARGPLGRTAMSLRNRLLRLEGRANPYIVPPLQRAGRSLNRIAASPYTVGGAVGAAGMGAASFGSRLLQRRRNRMIPAQQLPQQGPTPNGIPVTQPPLPFKVAGYRKIK